MKTHYIKTKLKASQKMPSALHSFVYDVLPQEELFTAGRVEEIVNDVVRNKPSLLQDIVEPSQRSRMQQKTTDVLNWFVSNKFGVVEIHSSKLEKLLKP